MLAEANIRAINSSVHVIRTKRCVVDLNQLLNRHGYKHGAEVVLPSIAEDTEDDNGSSEDDGDVSSTGATAGATLAIPDAREEDALTPSSFAPLARTSVSRRASIGGMSNHSRGLSLSLDHCSSDCDEPAHTHHGSHDCQIQTVCLTATEPLDLEK